MRTVKLSIIILLGVSFLLLNGCGSELQDLRIANNTQRERIAELESELQTGILQLDQLKRKLAAAQGSSSIEIQTLQQEIAALEEDIAKKKASIASMQERLLLGGGALPVELSTLLEDFASKHDIVTYDSNRGMIKFKSDLTFEKGSDKVQASAVQAVKLLCGILSSVEAKDFDAIIAGHTDDMRIAQQATRQKHPTNWHLSAHRAIAVLNVMTGNKVDPKRLSIRGFGEYRPLEANKANKGGNPQNRRVEIYIVAKGV
ncbi:MAG: OmpA/MotB family protein [Planctomycetota bacterium]